MLLRLHDGHHSGAQGKNLSQPYTYPSLIFPCISNPFDNSIDCLHLAACLHLSRLHPLHSPSTYHLKWFSSPLLPPVLPSAGPPFLNKHQTPSLLCFKLSNSFLMDKSQAPLQVYTALCDLASAHPWDVISLYFAPCSLHPSHAGVPVAPSTRQAHGHLTTFALALSIA